MFWRTLWQLLAPSRCAACDDSLDDAQPHQLLCAACLTLCEPCPASALPLVPGAPSCLSLFAYGGPIQTALLRLKWQGRDDLAKPLGNQQFQEVHDALITLLIAGHETTATMLC